MTTMSDTIDPLAPLDHFFVGAWHVTIRQLVSGPLIWEATHPRKSARAHRMPAGMDVATVRAEATKVLTEDDQQPT